MNTEIHAAPPATSRGERRAEQRAAARRRTLERSPIGRRFIATLNDDIDTITGQDGSRAAKREVAGLLAAKFPNAIFLYDRSPAPGHHHDTIDIIAVVPSGVWAIDVDCETPREPIGRKTALLAQVLAASDHGAVTPRAVLCTTAEQTEPMPVTPDAVADSPRQLCRLLRHGPHRLSEGDVAELGLAVAKRLPRQRSR